MAQMQMKSMKSPFLRLEPFFGMDVSGSETQIDNHHSPDMLNMTIDEKGALNKRTGYARVFPTSLGEGKINGMFEFRNSDGTSLFLIAWGTQLFTQNGNAQPVSIYNGLQNGKVHFFTSNGKCYILDGIHFLVYDGTTVSEVTPYVPTIQMSKPPGGGGTAKEDFNLIGNKFKDSFSGTGTDTVYQLSLTGLDATIVTATVGTTTITEGSGLTVDRVNGKVTFTTAPASGTNNVIITAGKTVSGYAERIKNCTFSIGYGGSNDTRQFVSGNPNMGEYVFRSGLQDPSFWPENGYYKFVEKVMGFTKQYDYLIIERLNGKSQVTYSLDSSSGVVSFPSKPINDKVGTIAQGSIQILDNNPVSLSKDGAYMITASNIKDERNVVHISENINKKMMLEPNLSNAISIDFDKKYFLAINNNVYVLDYTKKTNANPFGEWMVYDNIPASCFLEMGGFLYFGSNQDGLVYKFKKEFDASAYNDDGQPINAYWKSKSLNFDADEMKKYVDSLYFSLKPASKTSIDLYYTSDKEENVPINTKPIQFNLFDFTNIDFANFTFYVSSFPKETHEKVKAKQITHFQAMIQNNKLDESLTVVSLGIDYRYQNKTR